MIRRLRVGVVGVGYFGKLHARHYAAHSAAKLVAIADSNEEAARSVAAEHACEALSSHLDLIGRVDAATVAVPTPQHFEIARDLMEGGINVLVEKPMTSDVESATALAEVAVRTGRILQVGHIERYSACFRTLRDLVDRPLYLESNRIAPFRERGVDVDVVFDLMIHDIDIILGLVRSPVTTIDAVGTSVFSDTIDIANARIAFESGCVASVTASRISHKTERSLRVFQGSGYHVCDFGASRIFSYGISGNPLTEGASAITSNDLAVPREDSLANEISDFVTCNAEGGTPAVGAKAGLEAVRVAAKINHSIRSRNRKVAWYNSQK